MRSSNRTIEKVLTVFDRGQRGKEIPSQARFQEMLRELTVGLQGYKGKQNLRTLSEVEEIVFQMINSQKIDKKDVTLDDLLALS